VGDWKICGLPQATQHVVFHCFAVDRKQGSLHAHKVSAPKFRFAAGTAPLPFFMESLQQPCELFREAIYGLPVGKALIRDGKFLVKMCNGTTLNPYCPTAHHNQSDDTDLFNSAQLSFFCRVASVSDCILLRVVSAVSNLAQTCSRTPVTIEAARTEELHMLGTILIVILVLALFGALPRWSHSKNWGYFPTGGVGLVLLVVVILLALGRI
jgi:hypothetical protein